MRLQITAAALLALVAAAPRPQDLPDSSEVELVEPFDSGATDADGGAGNPVVIVVKPTSFGDVFAGFPGFGRFPGLSSFPRVGGGAGADIPHPPGVSLEDIFGGGEQELPLLPSANNCGLICKVFKAFEGSLGVYGDGEGNIRSTLHGQAEGGDYDNHNVTYTEKVLPDGSILRINKTVIQDTDENGNGFFFQSSVHHVLLDGEEEEEEIAGDVVVNEDEVPDLATVDEAIDDTIVDIINDPSKVTVLDTIEDPKLNEIDV